MGDDELNFTEQEASCWANDPRNQAPAARTLSPRLVLSVLLLLCVLLMITALVLIMLASSLEVQLQSASKRIPGAILLAR